MIEEADFTRTVEIGEDERVRSLTGQASKIIFEKEIALTINLFLAN